jgi:hypothetical protein
MKIKHVCIVLLMAMAVMATAAENTAESVEDRLRNDPYMIPFYTGKVLPFPREVVDHAEFYPLADAGILLGGGIAADDARLRLLLNRITQYGGAYKFVDTPDADCATIFVVGDAPSGLAMPTPPEHPQGYAVRCEQRHGRKLVMFSGRDHLGLTWAVNSLIQLITWKDGACVLHAMDIVDYPFMERRGALGPGMQDYVGASRIYPAMTKLDLIQFSKSLLVPRRGAPIEWIDWRTPRPKELTDKVAAIGDNLRGLGIIWQVGIMPFTIGKGIEAKYGPIQVDSKSDEHFDIIWKMCEPVLQAGGGIIYMPDDYRFPLSPGDEKNFGTARDADVFFMNRLYTKIKADYPNAELSMVQPFYYGPSAVNPWSKESPLEYLKALGTELPPDINIAWTGPSVKTREFTSADVAKFTELIKRKPYFFQNSSDFYHTCHWIYPTDEMSWWLGNGRDKSVYLELNAAVFNSPGFYPDMLWSAMLWNPDGYDAAACARDAVGKMVGPENYEQLRRIVEKLSWFDQFDFKCTPAAARNYAALEAWLAEMEKMCAEFETSSTHPAATRQWVLSGFEKMLKVQFRNFLIRLKKNPDLASSCNQSAIIEKLAREEAGFQEQTDKVFAAYDFTGGRKPQIIFQRLATWIYGAQSRIPEISASFEIEPYPPESGYVLLICGRDGGDGDNCPIEITLNGQSIFKGPNPFERDSWSVREFPTPLPAWQRYNVLKISNLAETGKSGRPYFALNYLITRKQPPSNE